MIDRIPYGIVYMTSRVFRGKVVKRYIGQHKLTGGTIEDGYLGSGNLLRYAINKYGRSAFVREVLEVCYCREDLNSGELYWIGKFDAVADPSFYNISEGGYSTANTTRKQVNQYDLSGKFVTIHRSITEAAFAVGQCGAGNIAACCLGTANKVSSGGFQWRHASVGDTSDIEPLPEKALPPNSRRVLQINNETLEVISVFDSINIAGRSIGCHPQTLATAANKCYSSNGFQWRYEDDKRPAIKIRDGKKVIRPVDQFLGREFVQRFSSLTAAAEAVGSCSTNLSRAIRTDGMCIGYRWRYAYA